MDKFTTSQTNLGDIHAPVEDTEVPLSLKLLVLLLIVVLGIASTIIASALGLLS